MSPDVILATVGAIFVLVATVTAAVAVARASLVKSTIETLRASNDALNERVEILMSDARSLNVRCDALENENRVLRNLKSGAEAVERLGAQLIESVDQARHDHHDILAMIEATTASITSGQQLLLDAHREMVEHLEAHFRSEHS